MACRKYLEFIIDFLFCVIIIIESLIILDPDVHFCINDQRNYKFYIALVVIV